jgi:DNA-binding transcriptional LysR family regulator
MFTLRQLEIFLAIAEHEHVTRAAAALSMTQSAASVALAELEKSIGLPLFERVGRGLRLNERGRLLESETRLIMQRLADLEEIVREDHSRIAGELRVGASSTIGIYLLPARIGQFADRYPEARVNLDIANTEQIREWLLAREIDIGFVEGPLQDDAIETELWLEDSLTVFASPEVAARLGSVVSWAEIQNERWILRESGSGTQEVFDRAVEALGSRARPFLTFGHTEAIKHAVEAGLGLGCLSRLTIERELERRWLMSIDVVDLPLRRKLSIVTLKGSYATNLRQVFLSDLRMLAHRAVAGFGI